MGVCDQLEQIAETAKAVAAPEAKTGCDRHKRFGDACGMLKAAPNRIGNDMGDCLRILAIVEKIERDARGTRDWQALMGVPLRISENPLMKSHIWPSRLPARGQDEVVLVCGKMAEPQ
jgi:hypothetical protein